MYFFLNDVYSIKNIFKHFNKQYICIISLFLHTNFKLSTFLFYPLISFSKKVSKFYSALFLHFILWFPLNPNSPVFSLPFVSGIKEILKVRLGKD